MTPLPDRLVARLLLAHVLVVAVMAGTVVLVAALLGPGVFHDHLLHSGHPVTPELVHHAEQAFHQAGGLALGAGVGLAALAGALVSVLVTRRLATTLGALSHAAESVAAGRYDAELPRPGAGREVDSLIASFATMAARLEHTELSRRRLLTDVAHELRTPISAIRVTLEAVEDGLLAPDAATLATLREQTSRLERLTGDIRAVSAADEGRLDLRPVRTSLSALAGPAVQAFRDSAELRGVRLDLEAARDAGVEVDADRIGQVLSNLLANALRHTPDGGRVCVTTDADATTARVTVVDTGDGIGAEHLPHVFERFYRTDTARDRDHGGTGVGLAISAGIARAHGGTLTAASEGPGRGATFTLTLPRA